MSISQLLTASLLVAVLTTTACQEAAAPAEAPKTGDTTTASSKKSGVPNAAVPERMPTIIPGERIDRLVLGADAAAPIRALGEPDRSDAAMGKAWMTWLGRGKDRDRQRWDVYTAYRDTSLTEKTVQLIRTTDSIVATSEGVGTGTPLDSISRAFPALKYIGHYKETKQPDKLMKLYDAPGKGIAFEIGLVRDKMRCTAIIVYPAAAGLMPTYQAFLNINDWVKTNGPDR